MADGQIFISYRRGADSGVTGRLHDRLERHYDSELLFMDVDDIPLGTNFRTYLQRQVADCSIFLAIIGHGWVAEHERLKLQNDFVRIEVEAALKRKEDIAIVPIFVDEQRFPDRRNMPKSLHPLLDFNGINIRHDSFAADVDRRLKRGLDKIFSTRSDHRNPSTKSDASDRIAPLQPQTKGGWRDPPPSYALLKSSTPRPGADDKPGPAGIPDCVDASGFGLNAEFRKWLTTTPPKPEKAEKPTLPDNKSTEWRDFLATNRQTNPTTLSRYALLTPDQLRALFPRQAAADLNDVSDADVGAAAGPIDQRLKRTVLAFVAIGSLGDGSIDRDGVCRMIITHARDEVLSAIDALVRNSELIEDADGNLRKRED